MYLTKNKENNMAEKIDNLQEDVVPESLSVEQLRQKIGAEPEEPTGETTPPQAEDQTPVTEEPTIPSDTATGDKVEEKETKVEDLILGKFKTPEEAYKAYEELESKSTKEAQLRSHYKENLSPYYDFDENGNVLGLKQDINITQGQPQQIQPQGQDTDPLAKWEERYNALEAQHGPVRASIIFNAMLNQSMMKQALKPVDNLQAENDIERQKNILRKRYSDFNQYEPDIDKYLTRLDSKAKMNKDAVETVYHITRSRNLDNVLAANKKETDLKAVEIEKQKEKAQVEHQTKTPEEPAVDLDNLSAADFKKQVGLKREIRY